MKTFIFALVAVTLIFFIPGFLVGREIVPVDFILNLYKYGLILLLILGIIAIFRPGILRRKKKSGSVPVFPKGKNQSEPRREFLLFRYFPLGPKEWLSLKYILVNNIYKIWIQDNCSHHDSGFEYEEIPGRWFSGSWGEFLSKLEKLTNDSVKNFPAYYKFDKNEIEYINLKNFPELRDFFGFPEGLGDLEKKELMLLWQKTNDEIYKNELMRRYKIEYDDWAAHPYLKNDPGPYSYNYMPSVDEYENQDEMKELKSGRIPAGNQVFEGTRAAESELENENGSQKEYVIFDCHKMESSQNVGTWLEDYTFIRKEGKYMLRWGVGWFGGYHNDGAGGEEVIPEAWFDLSWEEFIAKLDEFNTELSLNDLLARAGKSDWQNSPGLKEFFGYKGV